MPSLDIVKCLLILLPGFVTTGIIRSLTVNNAENDFDKVIRSVSYSFLNYALYSVWAWATKHTPFLLLPTNTIPKNEFFSANIIVLAIISIAVGCAVSAFKTHDGFSLLRKFKITRRSTRVNVWHDVFCEFGHDYVIVNLENGDRLMGFPLSYNDETTEPFLFLAGAKWLIYDEESGETTKSPVGNSGILITPNLKIASIEFMAPLFNKKRSMRILKIFRKKISEDEDDVETC